MRKRLSLLLILCLGGLVIMTGCRENKNSRQWIENKVSAVSRVYPTEDLFDLFKEFPEGFEIRSIYQYKEKDVSYSDEIKLIGDSSNKTITGTFKKIRLEAHPYKETITSESDLSYTSTEGLKYFNSNVSQGTPRYNEFLFQRLTLNQSILSQLKLKETSYNWETEDASIEYKLQSREVNNYFKVASDSVFDIYIGADNATLTGYEYGYPIVIKGNGIKYSEVLIGHYQKKED